MSHNVQVQEAWRKAMKLDKWQDSFFVMKYDVGTNNLYVTHEPTGKEIIYSLDKALEIAQRTFKAEMRENFLN